jgi:hypothetical protein
MANFKAGTRYTNGVYSTDDRSRNFLLLRESLVLEEDTTDSFFIIESHYDGRPDLISYQVYNRPDLGWVLMDVNNIKNPLTELTIGLSLRIPSLKRVLLAINSLNKELV